MQIKVCGLTNPEDALACAAAGVDLIGLNFCRQSPRSITPDRARVIADSLPSRTRAVGIFVDAPIAEVAGIARASDIHILQLHGAESPETCAELAREFEIIKALRAGPGFSADRVGEYAMCTILLDSYDEQVAGGTGQVGDWKMADAAKQFTRRLFLAGGLGPENVAQAISAVRPDGVDACSRLELAPGIKDHARIRNFVAAVRHAEVMQPD